MDEETPLTQDVADGVPCRLDLVAKVLGLPTGVALNVALFRISKLQAFIDRLTVH